MSLKICHVMLPLLVIVLNMKIFLVQSIHSKEFNQNKAQVRPDMNNAFHESKRNSVKNFVSNKDDVYKIALFVENLYEEESGNRFGRGVNNEVREVNPKLKDLEMLLRGYLNKSKVEQNIRRLEKREDIGHWDRWNNWSACSVSCGKGRQIRWRTCLDNCNGIETEMQEKACQLPECGRGLFGFIKV